MAAAAAELDPAGSVAMDLDPEAVHFRYMEAWVESYLHANHMYRAETLRVPEITGRASGSTP
jgi:hypothetical protein